MLKAKKIREWNTTEIRARIEEEEEELEELRFRHAIGLTEQNPMLLRTKRRDIARLKTVLNEKLSEEEAA
jgi:large subunit ribosomal protein L29